MIQAIFNTFFALFPCIAAARRTRKRFHDMWGPSVSIFPVVRGRIRLPSMFGSGSLLLGDSLVEDSVQIRADRVLQRSNRPIKVVAWPRFHLGELPSTARKLQTAPRAVDRRLRSFPRWPPRDRAPPVPRQRVRAAQADIRAILLY